MRGCTRRTAYSRTHGRLRYLYTVRVRVRACMAAAAARARARARRRRSGGGGATRRHQAGSITGRHQADIDHGAPPGLTPHLAEARPWQPVPPSCSSFSARGSKRGGRRVGRRTRLDRCVLRPVFASGAAVSRCFAGVLGEVSVLHVSWNRGGGGRGGGSVCGGGGGGGSTK